MSEPATEPVAEPQSEWLTVMLGEIARKRAEAELALAEDARREEARRDARSAATAGADPSRADV